MKKKVLSLIGITAIALIFTGCNQKPVDKAIASEDVVTRTVKDKDLTEIEYLKTLKVAMFEESTFATDDVFDPKSEKFFGIMKDGLNFEFKDDFLHIKNDGFLETNASVDTYYDPSQYQIKYDEDSNIITINYMEIDSEVIPSDYGETPRVVGDHYNNVELKLWIDETGLDVYGNMTVSWETPDDKSKSNKYELNLMGQYVSDEYFEKSVVIDKGKPTPSDDLDIVIDGLKSFNNDGLSDRYNKFIKNFSWEKK